MPPMQHDREMAAAMEVVEELVPKLLLFLV
jgi:hypothetical protein